MPRSSVGEMPGKRRDDQDLRVVAAAPARQLTLEMDEIAKWLGDQGPLPDGDFAALHLGLADAPNRAPVAPRGALEQLERRRGAAAKRRVGGGIQRIAEQKPIGIRRSPRRAQGGLVQLVQVIKHASTSLADIIIDAASRNQMVILCCGATHDMSRVADRPRG